MPQEPDLTPQEPELTPQEPDLIPQEPGLTPQEPDLTPHEPELTFHGPDLIPQEPELSPQGPDLTPQERPEPELILGLATLGTASGAPLDVILPVRLIGEFASFGEDGTKSPLSAFGRVMFCSMPVDNVLLLGLLGWSSLASVGGEYWSAAV